MNNDLPHTGRKPPSLDVKLHNKSRHRVVLTRADVRVEHVARLTVCYTQGDLPTSNAYGIQLPTQPGSVETPLNQQLGPDAADRFTLNVTVAPEDLNGPKRADESWDVYAYAYEFKLLIENDTGAPLDAGRFVVVLPEPPVGVVWYWPKALQKKTRAELGRKFGSYDFPFDQVMQCWKPNTIHLRDALMWRGARSADVAKVGRDLATSFALPS